MFFSRLRGSLSLWAPRGLRRVLRHWEMLSDFWNCFRGVGNVFLRPSKGSECRLRPQGQRVWLDPSEGVLEPPKGSECCLRHWVRSGLGRTWPDLTDSGCYGPRSRGLLGWAVTSRPYSLCRYLIGQNVNSTLF